MAITIQQAPTFPNIANNNLVYVVTSNQITQPQYQFVLDIRDVNGNLIQRVKQQPNPSGKGVFDIGQIIAQQFDTAQVPSYSDRQTWYSSPVVNANLWNQRYIVTYNNAGFLKVFNVYVGEEYGTTTTSIVTLYDGEGGAGDPAVTSTTEYQTYLGGALDINNRYPVWNPSWNLTTIYDSYAWFTGKYGIYEGKFADITTSGSAVNTPQNYTVGEGKWIPQPFWGTGVTLPNTTLGYLNWGTWASLPSFKPYQFNIGLTKYPNEVKYTNTSISPTVTNNNYVKKKQKLYWDDAYSLSFLSGQPIPSANLDGTYIPPSQMIEEGYIQFKQKSTGWIANPSTIPVNRDWYNLYSLNQNYGYYMMNSASLDYQMMHIPVGPLNIEGWNSNMKNPIESANDYTTEIEVGLYGFGWDLGHNFSDVPYPGSNWVGYNPVEKGASAFNIPLIFMDNAANPTGSYPASTAKMYVQGISGPAAMIHFTQSDAVYPGAGFPLATPYQIQSDINTQAAASGSSIRAYLIDNPYYEFLTDDLKALSGSEYSLLLVDDLSVDHTFISTQVKVGVITGEDDALGTPVAGDNSCTGFGTGIYSSYYGNSNRLSATSGSYQFVSTWDRRRYEIDWNGYEQYAFAKTIEDLKSCSGFKRRQFGWINEYGVYDYFTFTLAESITDDIERKDYKQTFVDFSTTTNTVDFDQSRRGDTQYYNKPTQKYRVESDWLDQEDADYVRELFFSTNVVLLDKVWQLGFSGANEDYNFQNEAPNQDGAFSSFKNQDYPYQTSAGNIADIQINEKPVIITNATITEKTNPRSQKLFRYSVEYQFANDLKPRV